VSGTLKALANHEGALLLANYPRSPAGGKVQRPLECIYDNKDGELTNVR
jgi:hypothetical protein